MADPRKDQPFVFLAEGFLVARHQDQHLKVMPRLHELFLGRIELVAHSRIHRLGEGLVEVLTLVQTERISRFPLICYGTDYWGGLLKWAKSSLGKNGYISPGDLDLVTLTDDPQEVIKLILDYKRRIGPPESVPQAFA